MSLTTRRRQLMDEGDAGMWIPGLGENKPRPREYRFYNKNHIKLITNYRT